jgi:hypothetical protein
MTMTTIPLIVMRTTSRPQCRTSAHLVQSHPMYNTPSHNPRTTSRYTCAPIVHSTLHLSSITLRSTTVSGILSEDMQVPCDTHQPPRSSESLIAGSRYTCSAATNAVPLNSSNAWTFKWGSLQCYLTKRTSATRPRTCICLRIYGCWTVFGRCFTKPHAEHVCTKTQLNNEQRT